jgi:hypothetical protein
MRRKMFALTLITVILVSISANFFAQGQNQNSTKTLLSLTKQTKNQLEFLINQTYANQTVLQTTENFGLREALDANVSLYQQGKENLTLAENQISAGDYASAQASLIRTLNIFRAVYKSVNTISSVCNPQPDNLANALTVIDANNRAQQRINLLKSVVPKNATNTLSLLDQAANCYKYNSSDQLASEEQIAGAVASMQQGNTLLSQIYQQLKLQGENLDSWRLNNYCNNIIAIVQERFQYGNSQGANITAFLQSIGYPNESDYISSLQQRIHQITTQSGSLQSKLDSINQLSNMIQNTDQALNQEIIRQGGTPNDNTGGSGGNSQNPNPTSSTSNGSTNSTGESSSGAGSYKGNQP